jgi:apolipoprotein N-acyltransferase
MSLLKAPLICLGSALLFAGAFPPFNLWWLAWLWALPLQVWLWKAQGRRGWRLFMAGWGLGWMTGFLSFSATLWWVGHVSVPGMLAMCVYLGLYPAVWAGFAALLKPATSGQGFLASLVLAMLWCGLEWSRGVMLTGFPWNGAAVPLVEMPGLRSLAAYSGVTGLSMLPFFFMSGLAAAWTLRKHRHVRSIALLTAATLSMPAVLTLLTWQKSPQPAMQLEVMLVQPNVSMKDKMSPDEETGVARYQDLAALTIEGIEKARTKPELIVWPESAVPRAFHDPMHAEYFDHLFTDGVNTLITGADALTAQDSNMDDWNVHNCAALMRGRYDNFILHAKVHLVPFGEYIPLRHQLPFLQDMLGDLIPTDFTAGTSLEPLKLEGMKYDVIPLICFEDTIADVARRFVREAPQVMVNITNDNWFAESPESAIHALNARWRCVELQRPMVRSANTGVTCVIDTEGRMTSEMRRFIRGVLYASVPLSAGGTTFFAAHGDVVSMTAGAAGLLLSLAILLFRNREP